MSKTQTNIYAMGKQDYFSKKVVEWLLNATGFQC